MPERKHMELAVKEAQRSIPEDSRIHPKVGAVITRNGEVISQAHRGEWRGSHAEFIALSKLKTSGQEGDTLYTTLEPCTERSYPKIPCANRIIASRIKKVVVGMLDPNPEISGKGIRALRQKDIKVQFFDSDLMGEVEELNREFEEYFTTLTLKEQQSDIESFQRLLSKIYSPNQMTSIVIFSHLSMAN